MCPGAVYAKHCASLRLLQQSRALGLEAVGSSHEIGNVLYTDLW